MLDLLAATVAYSFFVYPDALLFDLTKLLFKAEVLILYDLLQQ